MLLIASLNKSLKQMKVTNFPHFDSIGLCSKQRCYVVDHAQSADGGCETQQVARVGFRILKTLIFRHKFN